ncbi:MAG: glycosyltransferase [Planctomycetota bacterium]
MLLVYALVCLAIVALPAVMTSINLRLYRPPPPDPAPDDDRPWLAVCIPARDEADNIEACARGVLEGDDERTRVYVYDDESTDATPEIIARLTAETDRVRLAPQVPLPEDWNGKQHACWRCAQAALDDGCGWLLFTDADVRFSPDMARRSRAAAAQLGADLVSTFPRQLTGTLSEALLVPVMFYLLLGYLPFARMRGTPDPAASAGCGQFLMVSAEAYRAFGGHEAFKATMHDGIRMPRAARQAGKRTDLFDGTDIARVRMYRGFGESWRGFAKNAFEGLGSVGLLIFLSVMHLVGHVGPWIALAYAIGGGWWFAAALLLVAGLVPIVSRLVIAKRLRHSPVGALLHPVSILLTTAVQWHSWWLARRGRRAWRGRVQAA